MGIILEGQQIPAMKSMVSWFKAKANPLFVLIGFAGTGKTSIVKYVVNELGLTSDEVIFATPTGRAAKILRMKGNASAKTLYSAFYRTMSMDSNLKLISHYTDTGMMADNLEFSFLDIVGQINAIRDKFQTLPPDKQFAYSDNLNIPLPVNPSTANGEKDDLSFVLREVISPSVKLIILDEFSMIDDRRTLDILSFGIPVLAIGDDNQFEVINGKNTYIRNPDFELTELHRTAANDPIAVMATYARLGKPLPMGNHGNVLVVSNGDFFRSDKLYKHLNTCDQVIAGYKKTVADLNSEVRFQRNFSEDIPIVGDKLVCTKNNHDSGLMNGETVKVTKVGKIIKPNGSITLDVIGEDGTTYSGLTCNLAPFEPDTCKDIYYKRLLGHVQFSFGYALTAHACQGSQFNNVVFFNEPVGDKKRFTYTGITRAANSLVVVTQNSHTTKVYTK